MKEKMRGSGKVKANSLKEKADNNIQNSFFFSYHPIFPDLFQNYSFFSFFHIQTISAFISRNCPFRSRFIRLYSTFLLCSQYEMVVSNASRSIFLENFV